MLKYKREMNCIYCLTNTAKHVMLNISGQGLPIELGKYICKGRYFPRSSPFCKREQFTSWNFCTAVFFGYADYDVWLRKIAKT